MTNDEDFDVNPQDGFEQEEPARKASLKEAWDSNPFMKIAAIVLGGAVLVGGYAMIFGGSAAQDEKAVIRGDFGNVKQAAGKTELDPAYQEAIVKKNEESAESARRTGDSSVPTPIGTPKQSVLDLPELPNQQEEDPLKEWRKQMEKRVTMEEKVVTEEDKTPAPEAVPLVVPVRPQQAAVKLDPNLAKGLTAQMRTIIAGQAPGKSSIVQVTQEKSDYIEMKEEQEAQKRDAANAAGVGTGGGTEADAGVDGGVAQAKAKVIVPGGSIAYAQLLNALNSDVPGPVLAHVLSGPFAGGRAIGKMATKEEYIVITFNHIVKDGVTYQVDALALDENTTLGAHQTDVDHHYMSRVLLPAAAKFIEGYASAVATTGTTVTTTAGGGATTATPEPDANQELLKGAEESAKKVSEILDKNSDRAVTVKVAKGTTMGLFFTTSVTTKNAGK